MQQSVLLTAIRGPDGIRKECPAKVLVRWLRRCILVSATDGKIFVNPFERGGGEFTAPAPLLGETFSEEYLRDYWPELMGAHVGAYLGTTDEMPHHFQCHLMHAAEILGYKHPDDKVRAFWNFVYFTLVEDLHLNVETEEQLDRRLDK